MYYAGIYRMEKGTACPLVGFVDFGSKLYRNWFIEVASAFCRDDFEHGQRLDVRYEVRSISMKDLDKWEQDERKVHAGGSVCPRGGKSMSWSVFDYHNFTEIICATVYIQGVLASIPRAGLQEVIREYVDGIEGWDC